MPVSRTLSWMEGLCISLAWSILQIVFRKVTIPWESNNRGFTEQTCDQFGECSVEVEQVLFFPSASGLLQRFLLYALDSTVRYSKGAGQFKATLAAINPTMSPHSSGVDGLQENYSIDSTLPLARLLFQAWESLTHLLTDCKGALTVASHGTTPACLVLPAAQGWQ